MTCGGRRQKCARREQSAATPVHEELIYVVIPLRRFMLRGVRDKLFQERIRPTPPGPGPLRCPSLSPPGEGHPLTLGGHCQRPFGPPPDDLYLLGGGPPRPPHVGFAHKAFWWGSASWYVASGQVLVWGLPTRRSGGFWALTCIPPARDVPLELVWAFRPQGVLVVLLRGLVVSGSGHVAFYGASWWLLADDLYPACEGRRPTAVWAGQKACWWVLSLWRRGVVDLSLWSHVWCAGD